MTLAIGRRGFLIGGALLAASIARAQDLPRVRVGTLQFGTVNWELAVIRDGGLDRSHGFVLDPLVLADKDAAAVAFQSDAVDAIVTDWIWVARQRQAGRDFTFVPFSLTVGALMADPKTGIRTIQHLRGKRLGVAGGEDDKSWVLIQAYARKVAGLDLPRAAVVNFAAPPLLNQLALRGDLDAVLNFWQFAARLAAKGFRPVVEIAKILPELGLDRPPPLLGWVFRDSWAAQKPDLARGFLDASFAAKAALKSDDALWQSLKPQMQAEDEAVFAALRDGYRAGIPPAPSPADEAAAAAALRLMAGITPAAVGGLTALPPGTFWPGYGD
ncbi:ABC transporter substrate-binding protein [Inquilinus limosus]|uniref:ABC transporter substrate-binding protein n=1 Tax=Inquilinus limosus TaxID=171674 RepID=UPI003F176E67